MLTSSPEWARSCRECQRYVIGPNGVVSTRRDKDESGRLIEVPMLRSEANVPPPCSICPKTEGRAKVPLPPADDFGPLFWDLRDWFLESRAVGDFGDPSPAMRAVAAVFDQHERIKQAEPAATLAAALGWQVGRG